MPYIKPERRSELDFMYTTAENEKARDAGELNYIITQLIINYILTKKLSYQTINDIVGALEGAKLEFYRRIAVPYEQSKIRENGDVYPI